MNIEFLKWKCQKAEGFSFNDGIDILRNYYWTVEYTTIQTFYEKGEDFKSGSNPIYDLLTQKAIEGVNRDKTKWTISQDSKTISTYFGNEWRATTNISKGSYTPDQAKEMALMYIYEQESN